MNTRDLSALLLLGAIWGGSFMLMRVAAPEFGVFPLVELRTVLAAFILLPFMIKGGGVKYLISHWKMLCFLGAINTAIPFALFNYASLELKAGVLAILNATAPMFAAMIAFFWLKEKLSASASAGLLIGFFGVVIVSIEKAVGSNISLLNVMAVLFSGFCYGWAACLMKKSFLGVTPLTVAAGSQFWASLLLAPFTLYYMPSEMPSSLAWLNAIILAVVCTGIAYLLYFYLIASAGPAKAVMVGYLIPLFGGVWGMLFLNELLSIWDLIGGLLILMGISLTSGMAQRLFVKKAKPLQ